MLAAWLRMKFPNVVDGALAASAPIYYFNNRQGLDFSIFFNISTRNYETCQYKIRETYSRLENYLLN